MSVPYRNTSGAENDTIFQTVTEKKAATVAFALLASFLHKPFVSELMTWIVSLKHLISKRC